MGKLIACGLCLLLSGCAGNHSCCSTCGKVAAFIGLAALIGVADGAIDNAVDPEPKDTNTAEGKRKYWEWEQRQIQDAQAWQN
jgi:hypothetical protein